MADKRFYISIVSHGHEDLIMTNSKLIELLDSDFFVVIKDNLNSFKLEKYCNDVGFHYVASINRCGFGENNNIVFNYCKKIGMTELDYFVTLNPDVVIDTVNFNKIKVELQNNMYPIVAPKLFSDREHTAIEQSVRHFPSFASIFRPFLGKPLNKPYEISLLSDNIVCDWASGAFIVFLSSVYDNLRGFDESYFMYFEDVDICYRAKTDFNHDVVYLSSVHATHFGGYKNRNLFSKHFFWYLKSLINFLRKK